MNEILQDIKFGLRTLMKSPGFAFVALATIAIGIGANAAIFSIVDGVLLKPSPFKEIDRMVRVLVALLACLIPARKAMKVNPIVALRYD